MNENAQVTTAKSVKFERLLPGPIERVWEHLTETKLLPGWFGEGVIEHHSGGEVRLMGGHIRGVITQWHPPRRLAYTWNVFNPGEDISHHPESYLTFELEPRGKDVLLTLTHVPILDRFEKQNAMGWHTFLDMLADTVRGSAPASRNVYMKRNAERYGVDLANLAR